MKRFYAIFLFLILGVVSISNAAITVKFHKPASWTSVSLYTWGPEVLGGWPGAALTEEDGWYVYTFEESFTGANLIFNNGGQGEQTEDYVISATTCLEASSTLNGNGKYDVSVVPCTTAGIEVKFMKPDAWTAVSLYTWGPEVLGGWPGATLVEVEGWYVYTFDASFTGANLIFNNAGAGQQTEDYTISESVCLQSANTLNGNGKYDVTVVPCTTGISEMQITNLSVYPNPAENSIMVTSSNIIKSVSIHAVTGKEVMNFSEITENSQLDISTLNAGVYILRVTMENGNQQIQKIVKL